MHKRWKYYIILALSALLLVGCKTAEESLKYYNACKENPSCAAEMEKVKEQATIGATTATAQIPETMPIAQIIGGTIGTLAAFAFGVRKGKNIPYKDRRN